MKEYLEYKNKRKHIFCEFWYEENKTFIREGGLNIIEKNHIKEYRTEEQAEEKISDLYQELSEKGYEVPLIKLDILMSMGVEGLEKLDLASDIIKKEVLATNGRAIEFISSPSDELKYLAVQSNGTALEFIDNPSSEIQLEAIKNNTLALKYIENQTEEIIDIALRGNEIIFAHKYIKRPTKKIIVSLLKTGISLRDINFYFKVEDVETALEAIHTNSDNYQYLPDKFTSNEEIAKQLLIKDSKNIRLLSYSFRNSIDFLISVLDTKNFVPYNYFLQDLGPDIQETKELIIKIVSKNGLTLEFANSDFKEDREVVIASICNDINALIYAKKKMYKLKDIKKIIEEKKHKSHWLEVRNL